MPALILIAMGCGGKQTEVEQQPEALLEYPAAPRGEVADTYFGTTVPDPYRWLEDPDSKETRAWIDAENRLTRSWLDDVEQRDEVRDRLEQLVRHESYGLPVKRGGRYFYTTNDGTRDQDVLMVADALDAPSRALLDVNALSEDGTVSLAEWAPSRDGKHLAYGVSDGGSDWRTIHVIDVDTGKTLADEVRWVKFSEIGWDHDGTGFYYSRYAEPKNPLEEVNYDQKVYFHVLGTPADADKLVYERPDNPEMGFDASVTEDGAFLVLHVWQGTEEKSRIYYRDATSTGPEVRLLDAFDANYVFLGNDGRTFYFQTDNGAPKQRVIAVDLDRPEPEHWRQIIPEAAHKLQSASWVGDRFVTAYLENAHTVVRLFDRDGTPAGEVPLPGIGAAEGFEGLRGDPETFFLFESYTTPESVYRLDASAGSTSLWKQPKLPFDPAEFTIEQEFFKSKDGTELAMFLAYKKDRTRTGDRPTLLYGYGGFNIPILPQFKATNLVWMELGGVYASANLRGGGEYGREWHEAGTKLEKQNVFDDFIAAGEHLVDSGWTRPDRLAIHGRSNGGLLAAATVVQRPDLFGAAIPSVGVLDMLRYHEFTIGWAWASDYGTAEDSEEMFRALYAYSPYHNAKEGVRYPPILVTTADHDDRVVPAHSFKFSAAMQYAARETSTLDNPVLVRIETRAGHGAGTPLSMLVDEGTDALCFLIRALDVER